MFVYVICIFEYESRRCYVTTFIYFTAVFASSSADKSRSQFKDFAAAAALQGGGNLHLMKQ